MDWFYEGCDLQNDRYTKKLTFKHPEIYNPHLQFTPISSSHSPSYSTADNKLVIFNANPNFNIAQVFTAKIPLLFFRSLN